MATGKIRVIVPLDGSEEAEAGLRAIVPLAEREEVELILFAGVATAAQVGERKAYLDALCQRLRSQEIEARSQVRVGDGAGALGRIARLATVDFISMAVRTGPAPARQDWEAMVGGAQREGIALLLTRAQTTPRMWNRMIVLVDDPRAGEEKLASAVLLAKLTGAQLEVMTPAQPRAAAPVGSPAANQAQAEEKREAPSVAEAADRLRKSGIPVVVVQRPRPSPEELLEICEREGIDLLCLSPDSLPEGAEGRFGAFADALVAKARCTILVPARGAEIKSELEALAMEKTVPTPGPSGVEYAQASHAPQAGNPPGGQSMRRRLGMVAVLTTLAAAGIVGWWMGRPAAPSQDPAIAPATRAKPEIALLSVTRVASQALCKTTTLPGTLTAFREVDVFPKESGFVEWIGVDRGSKVKTGEPIVRLIAPELTAERRESEAKYSALEATYRRLKDAATVPGVVSQNDLDVAQKSMEAEQARVQMWKERMSYLTVTAPFDGIVIERNLHEGSYVGPPGGRNMPPIVRIQEVSHLRLVLPVPEGEVAGMITGDKLEFTVPAYPGRNFTGTLARISESIDIKTRTMPVELDVPNASGQLAPGMFAEVEWKIRRPGESLFVPVSAVTRTTERTFVVRVKADESVEWVDVKPAQIVGSLVEVFGAIKAGDLLVVRGTDELREGTKVAVKEIPLEEVANRAEKKSSASE